MSDNSAKVEEATLANDAPGKADDTVGVVQPEEHANKEPEEALETHEVVEINKFTERKEWIESKIKFLESMPPIEVYAGLEMLASLSEEMPSGFPTRDELNHWLEEHDKIEKETEIFDAEDMSKLKKFTKAATQKNLSPEDTDLIELTLTTLLALDKLLHLLRDRSETLDLLGLRITWEEQRIIAWKEYHQLLDDLNTFFDTRARWSLDTYDVITTTPPPGTRFTSPPLVSPGNASSVFTPRRNSAASISSDSSATPGLLSRVARYKLAEQLSHDAAIFASRLTSLHHTKVAAAGKTIDKLIDISRKPVPDEMLDEQDRLEDKAIKDLESVGKFTMAVVMQWRRADEFYNDTLKDQAAARVLLGELNDTKYQHPTSRLDLAIMSRAQALTKRLALKQDPSLPRGSFPRPSHPLFPDQVASNDLIAKALAAELSEAVKLAQEAEKGAREYHRRLEVVQRAERLQETMQGILKEMDRVSKQLTNGMTDSHKHGDASPPNLDVATCLDPMSHATYLAILPSVVQDCEKLDSSSNTVLRDTEMTFSQLKPLPGIDAGFLSTFTSLTQQLQEKRKACRELKQGVVQRVQRLKEARRLWVVLNGIMDDVDTVTNQVLEGSEKQRWRSKLDASSRLPDTPDDSPAALPTSLPTTLTPEIIMAEVDTLKKRLSQGFEKPFSSLVPGLESPLSSHLTLSSEGISKRLDSLRTGISLWQNIIDQAECISVVHSDARELGYKVDELLSELEDKRQSILDRNGSPDDVSAVEHDLTARVVSLHDTIKSFTDGMAARVSLLSRNGPRRNRQGSMSSHYNTPTTFDYQLKRFESLIDIDAPFDLSKADDDVRTEINAIAMRLGSGAQSLTKGTEYLHLACLASKLYSSVGRLDGVLKDAESAASAMSSSLSTIHSVEGTGLAEIQQRTLRFSGLIEEIDQFAQSHRSHVLGLISQLRISTEGLQSAPGAQDSPTGGAIVLPCTKATNGVINRSNVLEQTLTQLGEKAAKARENEDNRLRLEEERIREEERKRREEELERLRLEEERIKEEERKRRELESERLRVEEEERKRKEQELERLRAEEAARVEKERLEVQRKAEKERLEAQRKTEQERLEAQRKAEQERLEAQKKAEQELLEAQQKAEQERLEALRKAEREAERLSVNVKVGKDKEVDSEGTKPKTPEEDVFGRRLFPSNPISAEHSEIRDQIKTLRNRLWSLSIPSRAAPPSSSSVALPSAQDTAEILKSFTVIVDEASKLPTKTNDTSINSELASFRTELNTSRELLSRLELLGQVSEKITACDNAFSDLLEHTDTYPAAPPHAQLASPHISDWRMPCEEQLKSRLAFCKGLKEDLRLSSGAVTDDARVLAELDRIQQTLSELAAMCTDRINGTRSRPPSSGSSVGRSSLGGARSSLGGGTPSSTQKKAKPSLSGSGPHPGSTNRPQQRPASGTREPLRPPSHLSNRSVSGPSGSSTLFNPTFASRQRTTSLASSSGPAFKRPMSPITKSPLNTRRVASPTFSEVSTRSLVTTPSRSTWARAPRQSFGTVPKNFQTNMTPKRKPYVANPNSKLDMAVGNVVNNFRLPVTVQAAHDGWKDQSGKYWIGDVEPKLCFCRILRSHTVMVRVGGGWAELSKFLKSHFSDLLAELSPSPPRNQERWLSASSVRDSMTPGSEDATSVKEPATPESKFQGTLPSFQLSTPSGTSPQSIRTNTSSPGLTPLQYLRRAEPGLTPITPTKAAKGKPLGQITPSRPNFWRP
ncbi:hypothetical protein M422DRAFT_238274 [Sphaerobolus stellatus SS14]|nr:hypothetical protein M422DRAFT_238274 [Sphaerobolus stellatus SS14]